MCHQALLFTGRTALGIFLIGSTLKLVGHLTRSDSHFLKVAMKEAIHFRHKGLRVEMTGLRSADPEVLTILSAGCFLLRLVGNGARFNNLPDWLPQEFKTTVPQWGTLHTPTPHTPKPARMAGGGRR